MTNYGNFRNLKFTDLWGEAEGFVADYKNCGLYAANNKISDASAATLFYLLYSRFANSTIASSDVNQFRYQLYSIIFAHGPTWEKRLDIQSKLRALTDADIADGSHTVYNKALNPSTEPSQGEDELKYITEQNVQKFKRSKLDGYSVLYNIIENDVTSEFINRFSKLFLQIVQPEIPLYYEGDNN